MIEKRPSAVATVRLLLLAGLLARHGRANDAGGSAMYKNSMFAYSESTCCIPSHHHHRHDKFQEWSCGGKFFRTFHMVENRDTLYVGGMDYVYKLDLTSINHTNCQENSLKIEAVQDKRESSCTTKGKSEHFDCRNHIRVIQSIGDGSRIYVCGTNAHNPRDYVFYNNLTQLPRNEHMPGVGTEPATAKCPFDPLDNSTAIWSEKGNPGGWPVLYSGTNAEFTKADAVVFRSDSYNMTSGHKEFDFKRTLKYDSNWLDKPNFVGSYDIGEYVYFFFRETAVEYINCGKNIFSRVARVCKMDVGGTNTLPLNWVTYIKARLNCSIPGDYPFYFNEIQHVYKVPKDDSLFYAVFTTSSNGLTGSAICTFRLDDVTVAFEGRFKEQSSSTSAWLPVLASRVPEPRPGQCVNDTKTLPDAVLNFIRIHSLMDEAVAHKDHQPVFYAENVFFTRLVVDVLKYENDVFTVYYVGTDTGRVYKLVQWYNDGVPGSALLDIFDFTVDRKPITIMEISNTHKNLYVASDNIVRQIPLAMCAYRYTSCLRCVRDPYCGWNIKTKQCRPYQTGQTGLLQDVTNSSRTVCKSSVDEKQMTLTFGQSVHLGCFSKMPKVLKTYPITWKWNRTKGGKGWEEITFAKNTKHIATVEGGIVIIGVSENDEGRYECELAGDLLCAFNITVDSHRCSSPKTEEEYHTVYSNWCHEFKTYNTTMSQWKKKQNECSAIKQNKRDVSNRLN